MDEVKRNSIAIQNPQGNTYTLYQQEDNSFVGYNYFMNCTSFFVTNLVDMDFYYFYILRE